MSTTRVPLIATTGPRSVGTMRSSAPGASRRTMARKRASSAAGMSTRNRAGAWRGIFDCSSPSRLDPTPASITSSDSPRPRATDSRTVADPGRSSAAIPSRASGPPRLPQPPCQPSKAEAQRGKGARDHGRSACADGGELPVAGAVDGERRPRRASPVRARPGRATTVPRRWRHRRAGPGPGAPRPRGRPGPSLPRSSPAVRTGPLRPTPAAGPIDRERAAGSRPRHRRPAPEPPPRSPARWQSPPARSPRPRSTASPRPSAAARRAISRWR